MYRVEIISIKEIKMFFCYIHVNRHILVPDVGSCGKTTECSFRCCWCCLVS